MRNDIIFEMISVIYSQLPNEKKAELHMACAFALYSLQFSNDVSSFAI